MEVLKSHLLVILAVVLLGACSNQMQPAKQALDSADSAVSAVSADASRYDPDKLATLKNRLADLQAAFDRKDYASVLSDAPGISTDANALTQDIASKQQAAEAALTSQWDTIAASVPTLVAAVQARVHMLGKSRHLPKSIDLSAGKSALGDATSLWDKAQSLHAGGNLADAVNSAQNATAKLKSAADALRLQLPAAEKATNK